MKKVNNNYMDFQEYKKQNKKFIYNLQKFLDLVDNIQDEKLKNAIIYQKTKCDEILEELIFEYINK